MKMKGVTIQTEKLIEMVAERTVAKAIEALKTSMPCISHGEKILSIGQTLKGDNGGGLISKVEDQGITLNKVIMPKVSGLWWKIAIAIGVGVGLNKGLTYLRFL
jgi:hypothetical protein